MPWSGRTLGGRYTLGPMLGKGGMGAVYAATQNDLGRRVAVKVLHPHLAERPDLLTRFKREAMAAAALGHTNIVQVTDFCQLPGEPPFLVMEQLDGETLRDCMAREGPLPGERVAFITAQVLAALDAAHRAGIIHRDLKPENVFLTAITGVRDIVKVLDFGLAKHAQPGEPALTETGQVMGTPAYMAPEQVAGQPITPATDLYAVGALMYHALSGRMPFSGDNNYAVMYAIAQGTKAPISSLVRGLDPNLAAVVERAMALDPRQRFSSATEMRHALEPFAKSSAPAHSLPAGGPNAFTPVVNPLHSQAAPTPGSPGEAPTLPSPAGLPAQSAPYAPSQALSSPMMAAAPPAQKNSGTTFMIVAIVGLVVALLAVVGVFALVLLRRDDPAPVAGTTAAQQATSAAPATPTEPAPKPKATETAEVSPPPAPPPEPEPEPEPEDAETPPEDESEERSLFDRFGFGSDDGDTDASAEDEADAEADQTADANQEAAEEQQQKQQKKKQKKKKKRVPTAGTKPRLSFINAHANFKLDPIRAAFAAIQTQVTACYVKHEFSPGDHVHSSYHLFTDAQGRTTKVTIMGNRERSPDLDQCLFPLFRKLEFGPTKTGEAAKIDITYTARIAGQ